MTRAAHTRLRALECAVLLVAAGLLARLVTIQVAGHDRYLARAQGQWRHKEPLPSQRGNLYDRHGRPLALSATTWRVGISTNRVSDPGPLAHGVAPVFGLDERQLAARMRAARGDWLLLEREAVLRRGALDSLRAWDAVTLERLDDRIYPLDGTAASLVGFYRVIKQKNGELDTLRTGLELALRERLEGRPGEEWRFATGRPGQSLGSQVLVEPAHGNHLVLTLDADVQRICEEELARAIAAFGARGGCVLVVEPRSGELLAAAASPLIRERAREGGDNAVWNNRALSGLYEPGSAFKLVSAALLLRHDRVDTGTVFDCSDENFGRFRIHNSEGHSYGPLNLIDAFAKSSNIWFARAFGRLTPQEVYDGLRDFGFARRAPVPYRAVPAGLLAAPDRWNIRTQATLAIGQEIAVTPLQMAMAACAVANDGELPAPRLVREVRDAEHRVVEQAGPAAARRVLPAGDARLLRLAMARAVGHGTGAEAAVPWARVGGKTGTAQKAAEGGGGYAPGAYVSSFLGCVPVDEPRLVVLTLLDEPDHAHHYASQSAAPLFRHVVEGIRRSTDWLTGVAGPDPALTLVSRPIPSTEVPDVLYLSPAGAAAELRQAGLVPGGDARGGFVVEQVPGAGARCAPGDTIWITAAGRRRAAGDGQLCPDLRGLSNRQVDRLAACLGLPVRVRGAGYVARQEPAAGAPLDSVLAVTVVMEPRWN